MTPLERIRIGALAAAVTAMQAVSAAEESQLVELLEAKSRLSETVLEQLREGRAQDLLVLVEDRDVQAMAALIPHTRDIDRDAVMRLEYRAARWQIQKTEMSSALDLEPVREYSHLPLSVLKVRSEDELLRVLQNSDVAATGSKSR